MHKANRPRQHRVSLIDRELQSGSYPTVERLAELAEANERTIRRDLDYLRFDRKVPIDFCRKRRGWHYTQPTYKLPQIDISEGEIVALFFAQEMLRQHQGMPYEAELARAIDKLTEALPNQFSIHDRAAFEQVHSFRSSVVNLHDVEIFRKLANTVLKRKQIKITYFTASRDEESTRVVDPVHLALINGEWYLIGYCHTRKERRIFAPARIKKLELTGKTFPSPSDFHIGNYLNNAFTVVREEGEPVHEVHLRFAPSAAKYVREKIWHVSQESNTNEDGSFELSLELGSLIEVRRWILSWGSECEVLGPAELRIDILREATAIVNRSNTTDRTEPDPDNSRKQGLRRRS